MKVSSFFLAGLLFLLTGCKSSFNSEEELLKYLNKEENGLLVSKTTGHMKMSVKLLPAEYLAYREYKQLEAKTPEKKDSLMKLYENNLTFLMTIAFEEDDADLLKGAVENYQEYQDMVMEMNFGIQEYLALKAGDVELKPSLARMEDTYGLQKHRNIYIVFPKVPELKTEKFLDIEYTDYLFQTGINHFKFQGNKIFQRPIFHF